MVDIRKAMLKAMRDMIDVPYPPRNPLMLYPSEYRRLKKLGVDLTGCKIIKPIPTRRKRNGNKK